MAKKKRVKSPASKFGQIIGEAFESVVLELVHDYLASHHSNYRVLEPEEGKKIVILSMIGGLSRQMDNVIVPRDSQDPVALLETKWLKDARHHNDKGAWILQLREVRKKYATIRGAVAILAGFWTEGVRVMLKTEGGVKMVLVATDEQVYSTLQSPLDRLLGGKTFSLDATAMRKSYDRPVDLLRLMEHLKQQNQLDAIARSWLNFTRPDEQGRPVTGRQRIQYAIDELLSPLKPNPKIQKFEIALQLDTGNTIYEEFEDPEELQQFLQAYLSDPDKIIKRITPRREEDGPDQENS